MKVIHARRAAVALSAALVLPLALTACSDDSKDSASGSSASSAKAPASPSAEKSMDMDKPFGPACASVPKSGAGSFNGMAKDPVAWRPRTTRRCPPWSPRSRRPAWWTR